MKLPLHEPTIKTLLTEAKKKHRDALALFKLYDNSEDMHSADTWGTVVEWLKGKQ